MGHSSIPVYTLPSTLTAYLGVRTIILPLFTYSRYLFVAIVATVSWIETAKGSNTCKLLDQQLGLSAEQHQICLGTGGAELLLSVGQARTQDFPEECQYWMGTERWNCSGISMPVFAHSLKSPTSWVHKRESLKSCYSLGCWLYMFFWHDSV